MSSRGRKSVGTRVVRSRRIEAYGWLGAGAVTLGVGVAMTGGAGAAYADAGPDGGGAAASGGHATATSRAESGGPRGSGVAHRAVSPAAAVRATGPSNSRQPTITIAPAAATALPAIPDLPAPKAAIPAAAVAVGVAPNSASPTRAVGTTSGNGFAQPIPNAAAAVVVANPAPAASSVVGEPAPQSPGTQAVLGKIPSKPMSLRIDTIVDDKTGVVTQMVVYASGVPGAPEKPKLTGNWFTDLGLKAAYTAKVAAYWTDVLPTALGQATYTNISGRAARKTYQAIDNAYAEILKNHAGTDPVPIMFVGHSNGGQQLQAYAANGKYRDYVLSLYTFGSPIIKKPTDYPVSTGVLNIYDDNDPVVFGGTMFRVDAYEAFKVYNEDGVVPDHYDGYGVTWKPGVSQGPKAVYPGKTGAQGLDAHDPKNYAKIAKEIDSNAALYFADPNKYPENWPDAFWEPGMNAGLHVSKSSTIAYA